MPLLLPECVARHDRSILLPRIVLLDEDLPVEYAAACYYRPTRAELEADGKFFDMRRGLILAGTRGENDAAAIDNSLAHEWRHHWQVYNRPRHAVAAFDAERPYQQAIIRFFTENAHELDALLFAQRIAPCDTTSQWLEWLHENRAIQRTEGAQRRQLQARGRSPHLDHPGNEDEVCNSYKEEK